MASGAEPSGPSLAPALWASSLTSAARAGPEVPRGAGATVSPSAPAARRPPPGQRCRAAGAPGARTRQAARAYQINGFICAPARQSQLAPARRLLVRPRPHLGPAAFCTSRPAGATNNSMSHKMLARPRARGSRRIISTPLGPKSDAASRGAAAVVDLGANVTTGSASRALGPSCSGAAGAGRAAQELARPRPAGPQTSRADVLIYRGPELAWPAAGKAPSRTTCRPGPDPICRRRAHSNEPAGGERPESGASRPRAPALIAPEYIFDWLFDWKLFAQGNTSAASLPDTRRAPPPARGAT